MRISFERGFIDYIKHGNEQRLQLLSDALGEQYAQHGNWRFLRNNDRFVFQILRSFEHDNSEDKPGPGMPPHGWRTQFWVVESKQQSAGWSASAGLHLTVHGDPFWSTVRKLAR
ncbi:two-component sensor kinase [Escherichia coli]|uniref:Two-component sensor kinase n=1 Tax=Escherichia coli TaxID=562 RepID=A0A376U718_ECOLX|nr:two-component sensor kinase [Escherichia coli]